MPECLPEIRRILRILLLFLVLMNQSEVGESFGIFFWFGFGEVADLDELKGGKTDLQP